MGWVALRDWLALREGCSVSSEGRLRAPGNRPPGVCAAWCRRVTWSRAGTAMPSGVSAAGLKPPSGHPAERERETKERCVLLRAGQDRRTGRYGTVRVRVPGGKDVPCYVLPMGWDV